MTLTRWRALMEQWDIAPYVEIFHELTAAYREAHRYYHTVAHIEFCLKQFDESSDLAIHPEEVELALWFHDAVYDPHRSDNEHRSAQWANDFLTQAGAEDEKRQRVCEHIMATVHDTVIPEGDGALLIDIDLSILGVESDQYAIFEQNVRNEYRWVPKPLYARKRIEVLRSFLSRVSIYSTQAYLTHYEMRARNNLEAAIKALA